MEDTEPETIVVRIVREKVTVTRFRLYCEECGELAPHDTQGEAESWAVHHAKGFHHKKAVSR